MSSSLQTPDLVNLNLVPYIPYNFFYPKKHFLLEAKNLIYYDYRNWSSCTIYGIAADKNLSYKRYGLDNTTETKKWTLVKQCPRITSWLKNQNLFTINRARIWKIQPGEKSNLHKDHENSHVKNLIIPLNNPKGFVSKVNNVYVNFKTPVIYNNGLLHSFENKGKYPRYSIIINVNNYIADKPKTIKIHPKNVFTISFETFKNFLYENKHIDKEHYKTFRPYCRYLDRYVSKLDDPFYEFYGLFDANDLIGVTSIQEWQDNELFKNRVFRYRYIYIKKQYRGQDLGWKFLNYVCKFPLFAYAKSNHIQWCLNKNFKKILNPTNDGHQFLLLNRDVKISLYEKNLSLQKKDINELIE